MRYLLYNKLTDMRKSYHTLCGFVTNNWDVTRATVMSISS